MKGVQYIVDEHGEPKSVLIDLEVWEKLWEEVYDTMLAESGADEERVPWQTAKAEIQAKVQAKATEEGE